MRSFYCALAFTISMILPALAAAEESSPVPQLGESSLQEVIGAMTLEEKALLVVGMGMRMDIPGVPPMRPEDAAIPDKVPGAAGRTHGIPRLGIPIMTLADGPAGLRIEPEREGEERTFHATAFPIASLLASSWDVDLVREVGQAMGGEVLDYGVDILLAPGMNIQRNPLGGRNFEYFSEDPLITGRMAAAYVSGVQSRGVGTAIKHYAVNNQEFNRMQLDTAVSARAQREIYLKGFQVAVEEAQPWTVMSSYNLVNGTYTSESRALLTTVLREEWGFEGFVMTDWFGGRDPIAQMRAGNDLLMPGLPPQSDAIVQAVRGGALSVEQLDENVERILRIVLRSPSFRGVSYDENPPLAEAAKTARRAATEGMVLLENRDGALPLAKGRKIALFGNSSYELIIGGSGSGDVNEAYIVSLDAGLEAAGYSVDDGLAKSYAAHIAAEKLKKPEPIMPLMPREPLDELAVDAETLERLARETDVAVVTLGRDSGEFADRKLEDFHLDEIERALLEGVSAAFRAEGKKMVVVMNVAGVMEVLSWRELADAILLAWQPGQEGGHAIADVLGGAVNPSGRLAISFPQSYSDVPSAESFPGEVRSAPKKADGEEAGGDEAGDTLPAGLAAIFGVPSDVTYTEGIYVGYRYYETFGSAPAYAFGHGLSYTSFDYGEVQLESSGEPGHMAVTVSVRNSGETAGREVVQVYVAAPSGSLDKPARELRAFAKTRELAPGQAQEMRFELSPADLASFDPSRSAWVAAAGTYAVELGASSHEVLRRAEFELPQELIVSKVHDVLSPEAPIDELRPARVETSRGAVTGTVEASGVHVFRGIPYAAPPVGERRWQPPQPAASWEGTRSARHFGDRCMQKPIFGDIRFRGRGMGEDCLFLNVWTPDPAPQEPLPVLVYFYGGGFLAGDGSEPRYDGESMASHGMVAVTLNYRLGVFGFLAHPELSRQSPHGASGNYGLLDQAAALGWVRENIEAFGGDPSRVTIAGESAGSISVSAQMASPLSKHLFAGAIGESGSLFGTLPPVSLEEAEKRGVEFAGRVGAGSLAELRALSAEELLDAPAAPPGPPPFPIAVDGYFFARPPLDVFASGEQAAVPLLLGWNADEMPHFFLLGRKAPTVENYELAVRELYGERADEVLEVYAVAPEAAEEDVIRVAADLASDRFIGFSTWKWFELHRRSGAPTYRYFYTHPRPPVKPEMEGANGPFPPLPGAAHAAEIEYALGNLQRNEVYAWTEDDEKVSATMQGYFAEFVKTGDPNAPHLPAWPAASSGADETSRVLAIGVETAAGPELHRERYGVLDSFFDG